jgi:hypothetical protein
VDFFFLLFLLPLSYLLCPDPFLSLPPPASTLSTLVSPSSLPHPSLVPHPYLVPPSSPPSSLIPPSSLPCPSLVPPSSLPRPSLVPLSSLPRPSLVPPSPTIQGPLCEEPIRNVKMEIVHANIALEPILRAGNQIIPTSRRVAYSAFLTAKPRLMEPVFLVDIISPPDTITAIYNVLSRRRGGFPKFRSRGVFTY